MILLATASPALADDVSDFDLGSALSSDTRELEPYLQCAPYARKVSGIQIFGDARNWWEQAQGRYTTGAQPRVGAVMVFRPHRSMQLGHVATVSRVVDSRRVLLDHANWSPIDGRRGQVEKDVIAIDVSPANDWSEVRVWYAPLGDVGSTAWPIDGFIYASKQALQAAPAAARKETSEDFLDAFAEFSN
ncbi:MAG: CHAP domain-containing protein [Erythrobacter sp.]